jgi:predicted ATP-grasp superfamily ATP-dependent carboligase
MYAVAHHNSPQRRLTILLTEGASSSARQALYALGPQHTIDVLDPSPWCQCRFSRLVRRWHRCPSFARDPCAYLTYLGRILAQNHYDVLFSTHEEVFLLARVREKLLQMVASALPEFSAVVQLISKLKFVELLDRLQLPHPESTVIRTRAEIGAWNRFPQYLKLEMSTAGQGVRLVQSRHEMQAALDALAASGKWADGEPLLLQRPAEGQQAVARAVFRRGQLVGVHMSELRVRGVGGSAVARASCLHPPVVDHLRQIGERLAWHGPLFVDYFYDPATNTPYYVEADPRIGDTANATLSGVNVCQQCVDVAMDCDTGQALEQSHSVSSHAGFLLLISRALEGASRRDILAEMRRQWRRQGIYTDSVDEMTQVRADWLSAVPYAWIATRLLVSPKSAARIVRRTVENYSLSQEAASRISQMPLDQLTACLDG